jgi:HK97 family phage portal protein
MGLFDRIKGNDIQKRATVVNPNQEAAVNTLDLTGLWASAVGRQDTAELVRFRPTPDEAPSASAAAARAIDLIVQQAAARNLQIVGEHGEPVDHYLANLFNTKPNSYQSARVFRETYLTRLHTRGESFIVLDRGKTRIEDPKSAVVFHGDVKIVIDKATPQNPHGTLLAYKLKVNGNWITLAPTEVLWLHFTDGNSPWSSRAPITAALDAIGLSKAARIWQAGQLGNSGNPGGIIYIGDPENDEDYYAARREVEAALTGPSAAGRIAVTAGPQKPEWIPTGLNADEVGFLQTLQAASEEIALALGVPLDLVGGQRTYANVDASWNILWEGTIVPRLDVVASEINRQLLADSPFTARFDLTDVSALQEGKDAVTTRITNAVINDIVTLDEARAVYGFEPLPGGAGSVTLTAYRAGYTPSPVAAAPTRVENVVMETREDQASQEASVAPTVLVRGISAERADKTFSRLEAQAQRAVQRLAKAQLDEALRKLNRSRSTQVRADANTVFNAASWVERAYDYLLPSIAAALDAGAAATQESLDNHKNLDQFLLNASEKRARRLAEQVNDTTAKILNDRLAAAAATDNITVDQFSDVLNTTFDELSGYRAATIARTEMVSNFNAASREAAVQSNVVSQREWLPGGGAHSRPEHDALGGYRTTGLDDAYPNGLMFPGDPDGDPSETVNCRCTELYVTDLSGN